MSYIELIQSDEGKQQAKLSAAFLAGLCHGVADESGCWTCPRTDESLKSKRNFGEMLCLVHSEISEAMEGHRKSLMDDHLKQRPMAEVELADAVIRIFDLAGGMGYDIAGAIAEKLHYNTQRPDHKMENRKADNGKKY